MRSFGAGGGGAGRLDYEYFRQVGTNPWECWYTGSQATCDTPRGGIGTNLTANRIYAVPFVEPRGGTLDRIGMCIAAAPAAGNLRLGIYAATSTTNVYPAGLILDSGAISTLGVGIRSAAIAQALSANTLYYLACLTDTAQPQYFVQNGYHSIPILGWDSAALSGEYFYKAQAYGALPNPFPAAATITNSPPLIGVRYSA